MPACTLPAAVKEQKSLLESLLQRHGVILFRGFDSTATAADFNDVVEAFGYEDLPYVGGPAPRTKVVGHVFTANDSPPHRKIHFHHEMAHLPTYPRKLFFFCEEEAASCDNWAAKLNTKLEWAENGMKMIVGPVPGIKWDETRPGLKIWFNSMVVAYTAEGGDRNDPKKTAKGDILMIDNLAVLHSRKPFTPPRRILAALCI
ncbi:clavaminate synthase-like protein [Salvia divinorum]|uniref:Clavaminate synthase-like protein n=1 Tax=Salvia divinorum TaxID=28513 RepID=A0ABD1G2G7_SALDI